MPPTATAPRAAPTTAPPHPNYVTVPEAAARLGRPVDLVRKRLRRTPAAQSLFFRAGPVRVVAADRVEELGTLLGLR